MPAHDVDPGRPNLYRPAVIVALLASLLLTSCPAPQNPPPKNKLQESERRFWRRPDQASAKTNSAARRDDSSPLDVEGPRLPFEVAEKIGAELDIACGEHPEASAVTRLEPVQVTPEGEKALLVTVHHPCICGETGNCPSQVWTLDRNGHFKQSLSDQAYGMMLANTVHNGRYDVVTESYLTARESTVLRFEWDGEEYHPAEQSCRVGDGERATRPIVPGKCR